MQRRLPLFAYVAVVVPGIKIDVVLPRELQDAQLVVNAAVVHQGVALVPGGEQARALRLEHLHRFFLLIDHRKHDRRDILLNTCGYWVLEVGHDVLAVALLRQPP